MTLVVYIDACDYLKQCTFKKRVITGSRNTCWLLLMRMLDRDDEPKSWQHHPTPPPPPPTNPQSHAPTSMVKLNVDATIAGNIIAFAVVARDSYGEVFRV